MTSVLDVKTRIENILASIDGLTVLTGDESRIAIVALPAAVVRVRSAQRQRSGSGGSLATRDYTVLLMAAQVKSVFFFKQKTAYEMVYPWLVTIPERFLQTRRLELPPAGPIVHSLDQIEDSGPGVLPYKGDLYAGAGFTLKVVYAER